MADHDRAAAAALKTAALPETRDASLNARADALLHALEATAHAFDFFQALRRLECVYRDKPRWGMAQRPSEEPIRLGQAVSLAAAPATLSHFVPASGQRPARLYSYFFGTLGPNGPLPLHLTEYARQRAQLSGDASLVSFLDLFHHRLLSLFYRAFSSGEPALQRDRPESDRFAMYVGALSGLGLSSLRERDALPDDAKRYYAGLLAAQPRHPSGLCAMLRDYLRVPASIREFVGEWVVVPRSHAWKLGGRARRDGPTLGKLGNTALVGTRMWLRQHRFRIELGPLRRDQFRAFLPGTQGLARLTALVHSYIGHELKWDLRLMLRRDAVKAFELGASAQLGRTSWIAAKVGSEDWADLVLDPAQDYSRKVGTNRRPPHSAPLREEA